MSDILLQIKENQKLSEKIESIITGIEIPDNNQKAMLFTGFLRNAVSHFDSMNILIKNELYNTAFALVRIFFENIIRAEYMNKCLDDKDIKKLFKNQKWDKFFSKSLDAMAKDIDLKYTQTIYLDAKNKAYKIMNDYTHTGHNQIARWFNDKQSIIEPNFDENLVVDTLNGNYALMELFAKNYIAYMKQLGLLNLKVDL